MPETQPHLVPHLRILLGQATAIGPGKAELLRRIHETGSISAAARAMGMSYRRAWLLVDTMNQCFCEPLVETAVGGKGGGGAQVSALGHEVLQRYHAMQALAAAAVEEPMLHFRELLAQETETPPPGNGHQTGTRDGGRRAPGR